LVILKGNKEAFDYPSGVEVGQDIAAIMSFVLRCSVVSYNEGFHIFRKEGKPIGEALSSHVYTRYLRVF
jgi:hypothetical protein